MRYPSDGFTRVTIESDLVPGNVLRTVNPDGSIPVYSDCTITRFEEGQVYFIRPMVWSNGKMYAEEFSTYTSKALNGYFHTVLAASGEPYTMIG